VDKLEHAKASIRAKVKHPFRIIKRPFGRVKVRYRGLSKNTAQLQTFFALNSLWMVRRTLLQEDWVRARPQRPKKPPMSRKSALK
jgi:IS5 family transposase